MEIKLHSNATTTPRTRKYIQNSAKSDNELAEELNISIDTVRRWRNRDNCYDKSHRPNKIHKTLLPEQELLLLYLRKRLNLSLDELLEVAGLLINKDISRAGLNRCLKNYQIGRIDKPQLADGIGHIWLDGFLLPEHLAKKQQYLLICIEKFTGYIAFALLDGEQQQAGLAKIAHFLQHSLPYPIKSIECSPLTITQSLAAQVCPQFSIYSEFVLTESIMALNHQANFDQDYTQFISGQVFDKRLGLGAVLLEYEEILNMRIIRSRLKGLSPTAYFTSF